MSPLPRPPFGAGFGLAVVELVAAGCAAATPNGDIAAITVANPSSVRLEGLSAAGSSLCSPKKEGVIRVSSRRFGERQLCVRESNAVGTDRFTLEEQPHLRPIKYVAMPT